MKDREARKKIAALEEFLGVEWNKDSDQPEAVPYPKRLKAIWNILRQLAHAQGYEIRFISATPEHQELVKVTPPDEGLGDEKK